MEVFVCNYYDDEDGKYTQDTLSENVIEQEKRYPPSSDIELSCVIKMPPNSKLFVLDLCPHAFYVISGSGYYFKKEANNPIISMFLISEADDFVVGSNEHCKIFSGREGLVLFLDKRREK